MIYGSETPRVYTPPARTLAPETSAGFSMIAFAEGVLRMSLYPWQRWFLIHAFELNEDGTFRFRTVILLVARQNGKTTISTVVTLWFLFVRGVDLVLGTAQSLDISEDTWEAALNAAEENEELSPHITKVVRVNGKKSFRVDERSRYKVAAASRKGGRGNSADLVLLDELREHLNWDAWSAISKTTLARPDAVILGLSNAGDPTSVVLRQLRAKAHAALGDPDGWIKSVGFDDGESSSSDSIGLFEWSAPPGIDIYDRDGWRQSNPSLGYGLVTETALLSSAQTDPEAVFRTENLCQWVESMAKSPFPEGAWDGCLDESSFIASDSPLYFGIDVSSDRTYTTIAVCGERTDGKMHVEVAARRTGSAWAVEWIADRSRSSTMHVAYQGRGAPVSDLGETLSHKSGVDAFACEGRNLSAWSGRFWDAVAASAPESRIDSEPVYHLDQPVLNTAAKCAAIKPLGDGAWCFDRTKSPEDIAPLMACVMAFGLATEHTEDDSRSAYEDHGLRVV